MEQPLTEKGERNRMRCGMAHRCPLNGRICDLCNRGEEDGPHPEMFK